jgi:sugar phosphate isomerase/epimerase
MEIGIMARTFVRPDLQSTLAAIQAHGLAWLQFSMSCAGLEPLPAEIPAELSQTIGRAIAARRMRLAALSGTFNMIHPDLQERQAGLRRLGVLIEACAPLGVSLITLCTGSRDPDNMWRRHPDNDTPAAWRDLVAALEIILPLAERHQVTLGVEPEVANVIDSAAKARRLLDELGSARLKVVIDGANLFHHGELPRMAEILDEAFALLGDDIVLAHAKDLSRDGAAGQEAAGTGRLDYDRYLALLRAAGYQGSLILHSLSEAQVPGCVAFLQEKLARLK